MLSIKVYAPSAYLKSGKMKKSAHPEYSRSIGDTGDMDEKTLSDFLGESAVMLKREYGQFSSPYFFTHIDAVNKTTGERVRICEDVYRNGVELMTTPSRLFDLLTK